MQMVSVLALNKLELREMINTEIVENPVLEELEENVPLLDDVASQEAERERPAEEIVADAQREKADPFEEIDFGSYFQEYLDPGFRSPNNYELNEKPSFENFLSQPSTLADHLFWQLGSLTLTPEVHDAAEYIIGNIDECGYLSASEEELLEGYLHEQRSPELPSLAVSNPVPLPNRTNGWTDTSASEVTARWRSAGPPRRSFRRSRVSCSGVGRYTRPRSQRARARPGTVKHLDPIGSWPCPRECLLIQIQASHCRGAAAACWTRHQPPDANPPTTRPPARSWSRRFRIRRRKTPLQTVLKMRPPRLSKPS